jgi:beta-RFAP synthase
VHGFFEGGFLVEAGKLSGNSLSPLIARADFPESWRIVIGIPPGMLGLHGAEESETFQMSQLLRMSLQKTDTLCRLVLLGMLPALAEEDCQAFGEAMHDFNTLAGEAFAEVQGGVYASKAVAELVDFIRRQGIAGVGQSSWGPAVFAIVADPDRAKGLARQIQEQFALEPSRVFTTAARNQAAVVESSA